MLVDFYYDPICPWAWVSYRWLREVEAVRDIDVRWHLMSLAMIHEKNDLTEQQRWNVAEMAKPLRILLAARDRHGEHAMIQLYEQMGVRLHDGGLRHDLPRLAKVMGEAIDAAGLDPSLVEAMDLPELDEDVRRTHLAAVEAVGEELGSPVIEVSGTAFFGPVVSPSPRGEEAGRLWDAVAVIAVTQGFYELKRARSGPPVFS